MSARDDLAKVIFASNRSNTQIDLQDDRRLKGSQLAWAGYAADALLAAGYRKPRTITTAEELDALQIGSVAIDAHGDCFQRIEDADGKGDVVWAGDFMYANSSYLALPATVLHEPTP